MDRHKKKTLSVRVDQNMLYRLQLVAEARNCTIAEVVKICLEQYVQALEYHYKLATKFGD